MMRWLRAEMKLVSEHRNSTRFSSSSSKAVRTTSPRSSTIVAPWLSSKGRLGKKKKKNRKHVCCMETIRKRWIERGRTPRGGNILLGQARRTRVGFDSCPCVPSSSKRTEWIRWGRQRRAVDPICSTCSCRFCWAASWEIHWPSSRSTGIPVQRQAGSKSGQTTAAGDKDSLKKGRDVFWFCQHEEKLVEMFSNLTEILQNQIVWLDGIVDLFQAERRRSHQIEFRPSAHDKTKK